MTNEELIKKLRDLHRDPRPASAEWLFENQVALYDAAAAIEALQAKVKWMEDELSFSESSADEFQMQAALQNALLAKQLPKRGEWVKGPDGLYHCSTCGATAPYLDAFDGVIQYWENLFYCNNCGAKMDGKEKDDE